MRLFVLVMLAIVSLGGAPAQAGLIVLDFEDALPGGLFTTPLYEDGYVFRVRSGHYDIGGFGTDGSSFNMDGFGGGSGGPLDFAYIALTREDGGLFDVESMEVVTPSGENFSMLAVGNTGNIFSPTTTGLFVFGDDFHGVSALVTRQNRVGFFAFDNLTVSTPMLAPATLPSLFIGLLTLGVFRRNDIRPRDLSPDL